MCDTKYKLPKMLTTYENSQRKVWDEFEAATIDNLRNATREIVLISFRYICQGEIMEKRIMNIILPPIDFC